MKSIVYNKCCLAGMQGYADKQFTLALPDPPYGLKQDIVRVQSRCRLASSVITEKFDWDKNTPDDNYFEQLFRVSENQIIWGGNYYPQLGATFKAPRRKEYAEWIAAHPRGWIIWDKCNGASDFSDCELAWTSLNVPTQIFFFMWHGMRQGKSMSQGHIMQGNKKLNEKKYHPTQKPVILYDWVYKTYLPNGGTVIDTHLGSGSNRIAADRAGNIDFTGYEIGRKYFVNQETRYKEHLGKLILY